MAPASSSDSRVSTPDAPPMPSVPLPDENALVIPITHPVHLLSSSEEYILYDFSLPIEKRITTTHPLYDYTHTEAATDPPKSTIHIFCPQVEEGLITIAVDENDFVSVLDVFNHIHGYLHESVDGETLTSVEELGAEVQFLQRCLMIVDPEVQARESEQGIKRVDLLGGKYSFAGLSRSEYGDGVFNLHLRE